MCGFVVVLERDPARPVDPGLLLRAREALAHRGPDDAQEWRGQNVGIGFRRLAVLDPSPSGRQPMRLGEHVLALNGEVYNFQALRASLGPEARLVSTGDAEVVLHLLAREGLERALARLRGMFAFARWDGVARRLELARDRMGQKPLYVWRGPRRVIVASELKAILADPEAPRTLDPAALRAFLAFGSVPEPLAALPGVQKLLPGEWLVLDERGDEVGRGRTWDPAELVPPPGLRLDPERAAKDLLSRLRAAVTSHLVADVPVGAFLSGGLDSAGIVALAAEARRGAGAEPLHTFSVGFPGSALDESAAAAATARALGTVHHALAVTPDLARDLPRIAWHLDEPCGAHSAAATYWLAREARRHVTVALSGDGADELLGGYPWRHGALAPTQLALRVPRRARRALAALAAGTRAAPGSRTARALEWARHAGQSDGALCAELVRLFSQEEEAALLPPGTNGASPTARFEARFAAPLAADGLARALLAEVETTLPSEMLAKVDRTSMAWGLEVRVPYLDEGVVDLALGLPSGLKCGLRTGKLLLRRALRDLVPAAAIEGPKRGFTVPVSAWLRGDLREHARGRLESLAARGLVRGEAVRALHARHLGGEELGGRVYALLALEEWCRAFLDRAEPWTPPA